jgi:hypothetical protein
MMTATALSAAASGPGPDLVSRYVFTIAQVEVAARELHSMAAGAYRVVPQCRAGTLVELHNQARVVAALLNHALGGWPEPPEESEPGQDTDWAFAAVALPLGSAWGPGLSTGTHPSSAVTAETLPTPVAGDAGGASRGECGPAAVTAAPALAGAETTAHRFAVAWARPGVAADVWLAGVTDFILGPYSKILATVDPATIPTRAVTGPPAVVSSTTVAVFDVPMDTGRLRLTCTALNGQWLVTNVTRLGHHR